MYAAVYCAPNPNHHPPLPAPFVGIQAVSGADATLAGNEMLEAARKLVADAGAEEGEDETI